MFDNHEKYITIRGWMVEELKLSGLQLLAYALVYGLSCSNSRGFEGSYTILARWLGCSRRQAVRVITQLCEQNLITKTQVPDTKTAHSISCFRVNPKPVENYTIPNGDRLPPQEGQEEHEHQIFTGDIVSPRKGHETPSVAVWGHQSVDAASPHIKIKELNNKKNKYVRARPHERNVNTSDSLPLAADVELPSLGEGVADLVASETETQPNVSKQNKTTPKRAKKSPLTREQVQQACDGANIHESVLESVLDFVAHRREKNKPLTPRALTLLLNKLVKISSDPQVQVEALEEAIFRGWDGVYPPKPQWQQTQHKQHTTPRRQEQELEPPTPSQLDMEVFRQYGISNWTLFHVQKFVRKDETLADAECKCVTCLKDSR